MSDFSAALFEEALDLFEEASFEAYLAIRDNGIKSEPAQAAMERKSRKRQALLDYVGALASRPTP